MGCYRIFLISLILMSSGVLAEETEISLDGDRLIYLGKITAEANDRARTLFEQADARPERLVIQSDGGKVADGLDLGRWIHQNGLDVEIAEQCLSSCANYVFPAGRTKWLRRDSVLLWHGSAWQPSFDDLADPDHPDFKPHMLELREREVRFFSDIAVDPVITIYGLPAANRFRFRRVWGFDYSLESLERLGVSDIRLIDGEWDWREHKPRNANRVVRVELDDDYSFQRIRHQIE